MTERLVLVATCATPHEARIVAGRLEASGLTVTLQDEHATALSMGPEAGGVELLVPESDAPQALGILRSEATP